MVGSSSTSTSTGGGTTPFFLLQELNTNYTRIKYYTFFHSERLELF